MQFTFVGFFFFSVKELAPKNSTACSKCDSVNICFPWSFLLIIIIIIIMLSNKVSVYIVRICNLKI